VCEGIGYGAREGWICWAVMGQGRGGWHEDRTGAGIGVVLLLWRTVTYSGSSAVAGRASCGTRPRRGCSPCCRPPTSCRGRQTSRGAAVRSTQLPSPPARGRWDRQGKCGSRSPTLCRWRQTLSGVLSSAPLNLLHHRRKTGGIDWLRQAQAWRGSTSPTCVFGS
jgi:hypothetical protein